MLMTSSLRLSGDYGDEPDGCGVLPKGGDRWTDVLPQVREKACGYSDQDYLQDDRDHLHKRPHLHGGRYTGAPKEDGTPNEQTSTTQTYPWMAKTASTLQKKYVLITAVIYRQSPSVRLA